jgi:hypothetical protein
MATGAGPIGLFSHMSWTPTPLRYGAYRRILSATGPRRAPWLFT